jgi:DMSO reductase anchor subunit
MHDCCLLPQVVRVYGEVDGVHSRLLPVVTISHPDTFDCQKKVLNSACRCHSVMTYLQFALRLIRMSTARPLCRRVAFVIPVLCTVFAMIRWMWKDCCLKSKTCVSAMLGFTFLPTCAVSFS